MNKRSATDDNIVVKVSRKRMIYTTDIIEAKRYQLLTEIKTCDSQILYTTWSVFSGIEYFEKMIDANMRETKDRKITFTYLSLEYAKDYLDLIYFDTKLTLRPYILQIYDQSDYHQIQVLKDQAKIIIENLSYSITLYNWNKVRQLIPDHMMALKLYQLIKVTVKKLEDKIEVPVDDEAFINLFLDTCSAYPRNNHLIAWAVLREIPYEMMVKSIHHYCGMSVNIGKTVFTLMSKMIDVKLIPHRDLFISYLAQIIYVHETKIGIYGNSTIE
jgi:hypothetical protein